jgi:inorganic triphosphatase YgiF
MTTGTLRNAHETQGTTLSAESPMQPEGIWDQRQLGDWTIVHRRLEHQRVEYFDTADGQLGQAQASLLWRRTDHRPIGMLTLETAVRRGDGSARRRELTALLPRRADPLSYQPVPEPLYVARTMVHDDLEPVLSLWTECRVLQLQRDDRRAELSLERVRMPGGSFSAMELDLRLIAGRPTDLESLRAALQELHGSRYRAVDAEERGYVRLDRVGRPPYMPRPA